MKKLNFKKRVLISMLLLNISVIIFATGINYFSLNREIYSLSNIDNSSRMDNTVYNISIFLKTVENKLSSGSANIYTQFKKYVDLPSDNQFEKLKQYNILFSHINMLQYGNTFFEAISLYDIQEKSHLGDTYYSYYSLKFDTGQIADKLQDGVPQVLLNNLEYITDMNSLSILPIFIKIDRMVMICFINLNKQNLINVYQNENLLISDENTLFSINGAADTKTIERVKNMNKNYIRLNNSLVFKKHADQYSVISIIDYNKIFEFWIISQLVILIVTIAISALSIILSFILSAKISLPLGALTSDMKQKKTLSTISCRHLFSNKYRLSRYLNTLSMATVLKLFFYVIGFIPLLFITTLYLSFTKPCITKSVQSSMQNTVYNTAASLNYNFDIQRNTINAIVLNNSTQHVYYSHYDLEYKDNFLSDVNFISPTLTFSDVKESIISINNDNQIIDNYILLDNDYKIIDYSNNNHLPKLDQNSRDAYFFSGKKLYYLKPVVSLFSTKSKSESPYDAVLNRKLGYILFTINTLNFFDYSANLNNPNSDYMISYRNHIFIAMDKNIIGQEISGHITSPRSKNQIVYRESLESDSNVDIYYLQDEKILSSYYTRLLLYTILFFISISAIIFLMSQLLSSRFLKEISRVSRTISRMNDLQPLTDFRPQCYEIQTFTQSFNEMVDRINTMIIEAKERQIELKHLELIKNQSELIAYQTQMDPHFLYNAFANVSLMIKTNNNDEALKFLSAIANMLKLSLFRNVLNVPLREELEHMQAYLAVQKLRFKDKIIINIDVPASLMECSTLKLILQPIVENNFIHGIEPKGHGTINIKIYSDADTLIYEIRDDGIGLTAERLKEVREILSLNNPSKHFGLANVNQRIKLNFGENYGIEIYGEQNNGSLVRATLPLIRNAK